jgi:CRISPR/Cas system-associated exonuclease Cas4 (RecB family)
MSLSEIYNRWKSFDLGGYTYKVHIGGTKERGAGIHASEISKCKRLVVYNLRGEEKKPATGESRDVGMQRRFDIGHAVHAMLQKEYELMCAWMNAHHGQTVMTFEAEVKIAPELQAVAAKYELMSHCDGILTFWWDGVPYLRVGIEFKTKSGPEYEKLKRPDDDHMEQTCFYMGALDLPLMFVVYYNKSNSNMTQSEPPWVFQFDKGLWQKKLQPLFEEAHQHRAAGTLPDREEGQHCGWCPFSHVCKPSAVRTSFYAPVVHSPGAFRPRTVKT